MFPIEKMCQVLKGSRSGHYGWPQATVFNTPCEQVVVLKKKKNGKKRCCEKYRRKGKRCSSCPLKDCA